MELTLNGTPILVDDIAAREIVHRHLVNSDQRAATLEVSSFTLANPSLQEGETLIGSYAGPDGKVTFAILLPEASLLKQGMNWVDALAWARGLRADIETDAPNRIEGLLLFLHHRALFEKDDVLWLNEESAGDSVFAWYQTFYYGHQYCWHEDSKRMARAVRRVTI